MISINNLKINATSDEIAVEVETTTGNTITQVLIWTADTYKDSASAIDVSSLLAGTSETEVFTVPVALVNLEYFTGAFFFEFTSSNVEANPLVQTTAEGATANLTKYANCILDALLSLDISGCKISLPNNCCGEPTNVCFINAMLDATFTSLLYCDYTTAAELINSLKVLCTSCLCYNEDEPGSNITGVYMENTGGDCEATSTIKY